MLNLFGLATGLSLVLPLVLAACTEPRQRQDWRTFDEAQRKEYIDAVLCLQNSPAQTDIVGSLTRFDDFQGAHIALTDIIHFVGQFLPWHRYMMWAYESALVEECGYTGSQPYWNETTDTLSSKGFQGSPIFNISDPYSFGGSGSCVTTGPFANYTLHLGPAKQVTDHCLTRRLGTVHTGATAEVVNGCLANDKFADMWPCVEAGQGPHGAGHGGVFGEMLDVYAAPGDPVFYMHHTWIDKLWADWQSVDKGTRVNDIAGYTTFPINGNTTGLTPTTLDDVMTLRGIRPDMKIREIMDTESDTLCYVYV